MEVCLLRALSPAPKRQTSLVGVFLFGVVCSSRLSFLAQSADCFALGHRADEAYVHAYLAPKKRYQRFSLRAARPALTKRTSTTLYALPVPDAGYYDGEGNFVSAHWSDAQFGNPVNMVDGNVEGFVYASCHYDPATLKHPTYIPTSWHRSPCMNL